MTFLQNSNTIQNNSKRLQKKTARAEKRKKDDEKDYQLHLQYYQRIQSHLHSEDENLFIKRASSSASSFCFIERNSQFEVDSVILLFQQKIN